MRVENEWWNYFVGLTSNRNYHFGGKIRERHLHNAKKQGWPCQCICESTWKWSKIIYWEWTSLKNFVLNGKSFVSEEVTGFGIIIWDDGLRLEVLWIQSVLDEVPSVVGFLRQIFYRNELRFNLETHSLKSGTLIYIQALNTKKNLEVP